MDYCNLTDKEFKIAVRKKFGELQENSERLYNDLRNKINKIIYQRGWNSEKVPNKFWSWRTQWDECIRKLGSQVHQMEQRANELMGKNIEMFQVEEERELRLF